MGKKGSEWEPILHPNNQCPQKPCLILNGASSRDKSARPEPKLVSDSTALNAEFAHNCTGQPFEVEESNAGKDSSLSQTRLEDYGLASLSFLARIS